MKSSKFLLIILVVLTLVFSSITSIAKAADGIAPGEWSRGTEFIILPHLTPPPNEWVQQLGNGVEVAEKGTICHNFNGGRYGWTADIYQWKSGQWVKLPTTLGWDSNAEGHWVACAKAPKAGKYAMFGYWTRPSYEKGNGSPAGSVPPSNCDFDMSSWAFDYYGLVFPEEHLYLMATVPDVPEGTAFSYQVVTGHPNLTITGSGTGNASLSEGPNIVQFTSQEISMEGSGTAVIRLTTGGCSRDIPWSFTDPTPPD